MPASDNTLGIPKDVSLKKTPGFNMNEPEKPTFNDGEEELLVEEDDQSQPIWKVDNHEVAA